MFMVPLDEHTSLLPPLVCRLWLGCFVQLSVQEQVSYSQRTPTLVNLHGCIAPELSPRGACLTL